MYIQEEEEEMTTKQEQISKKGKHKNPRCHLDRRRKCIHPALMKNCKDKFWICKEMDYFLGEKHEVFSSEAFLQKHQEMRGVLFKHGYRVEETYDDNEV